MIGRRLGEVRSDGIVLHEGVPGLWGASGKFHPVTVDMGVNVVGEEDNLAVVSTIPDGVSPGLQALSDRDVMATLESIVRARGGQA